MENSTVDNGIITIAGYAVDTTVKSHPIEEGVLKEVRKIIKKAHTKTAAAKVLNVKRQIIDRIYTGACAPETYIQILNTLYPQSQTAA